MTPISQTSTTRTFTRVQIAGYRIGEPQGRWGSVAAFAALRPGSGESAQMRLLLPPAIDDAACRQRFVAVARRAQGLQHRHLVACHDAGEEGRRVYQVWEPQFSTLGRAAAATPRDALRVAMECARALEAIHHDGLVHGQIGADQVWTRQDGTTVLGPFGLPPVLLSKTVLERLELNRQCGGTLAPELMISGGEPDQGSDLYALAALLAQLLGVTLPCPTTSEQLQRPLALRFHVAENLPLPADLVKVLATALAPQAAARYASAGHLREDLERLYFDFTPIHAGATIPAPPPRRATTIHMPAPRAPAPSVAEAVFEPPPKPAEPSASAPLPASTPLPASAPLAAARTQPPRTTRAPLQIWPPKPVALITIACLAIAVAALAAVLSRAHSSDGTAAAPSAPTAAAPSPEAPNPEAPNPAAGAPPVDAHDAAARAEAPWAAQAGGDACGSWASLALGGVQVRFRHCAPGRFRIGSPADEIGRAADEDGAEISLTHGFWIAETSLTQAAYRAVSGGNPSHFVGDDLPVESVSWDETTEFCRQASELAKVSLTLPTEAQWEYACRAGGDAAFPAWGWCGVCWSSETSGGHPHPVGQLAGNAWGLKDMQGNVMQWCADTAVPYPTQPVADWRGDGGLMHPARGGAWCVEANACRAAARARYGDSARYFFIGLRPILADSHG